MSGPRRRCLNLAKAFADVKECPVDIFSFGGPQETLLRRLAGPARAVQTCGVRITQVGCLLFPFLGRQYDVIYIAAGQIHAFLPLLMRRIFGGGRIVYYSAGIVKVERRLHHQEETRGAVWREWVERFVVRQSDSIICPSSLCASTLAQEYNVNLRRITVIPSGVEDGAFIPPEERHTKNTARPMITTVAKLHRCKGVHFLLESLARLRDREFAVEIISGGGAGAYRRELERIIAATDGSLSDKVRFVGPVGTRELRQRLACASIYVQPSTFETFGLAVLEAMAAGLPVIVTSATGASFLVQDGVNGFVVPPGDHEALAVRIKQLIDQPLLRENMSEANVALARKFSWDSTAAHLYDHFLQNCASLGPSHAGKRYDPRSKAGPTIPQMEPGYKACNRSGNVR